MYHGHVSNCLTDLHEIKSRNQYVHPNKQLNKKVIYCSLTFHLNGLDGFSTESKVEQPIY